MRRLADMIRAIALMAALLASPQASLMTFSANLSEDLSLIASLIRYPRSARR